MTQLDLAEARSPAAPRRSSALARAALYSAFLGAAATAALLALAAPPHDHGWLAWAAPVPFFCALLRLAPPAAFSEKRWPRPAVWWTGFLLGFIQLLLLVPWFAAFTPAGYPVAAAYWGLLSGAAALLTGAALRRCGAWWAAPVLAAGWTVMEWLRTQGVLAFPWGSLAATQYRYLPVLQVVDLCGAFGLSFLMSLPAASVALCLRPSERRTGSRWAAVAALLVAGSMARGAWILARPAPVGRSVRVAVVQASTSTPVAGARVECVSHPEDYQARTRDALAQGAELVVWPESASLTDLAHDVYARMPLVTLLAPSRAHLLAGAFVRHPPTQQVTNAAVMLSPGGRVLGQYAKVRIVPFGEYLPARPLLGWTEQLGMPADDLRAGDRWTPLAWPGGSVGASICFESAFGDVSRSFVNQGADLLAVLTSDGWAGRKTAGLQHAAFAPLRATETRRSVARAATTGVSQLIDPYGRVVQSLPMFTQGATVADLPLRTDRTLYVRLGDWPVWLSWALLLGILWSPAVRRLTRPRERAFILAGSGQPYP